MKVIIEKQVENATFLVSFVKNGETLQSLIKCPTTHSAVRRAYSLCKDSDGFSMWHGDSKVASGFGIPGMDHLEIIK